MAPSIAPAKILVPVTGPMILGFMWSYMLYGGLVVQIYMYTEAFPTDRRGLKILVWVVLFFETCFTALMTVAAWNMFGSGWGQLDVLLQLNWSWGFLPFVSGILSTLAQGFYTWRIWHLTKQFWWPVPIILTILAQYVALFWFGIQASDFKGVWNIAGLYTSVFPQNPEGIGSWLAAIAFSDVLITIALTSHFWRCKQKTKFAGTTGMLNRLIRLSIETGALTSIPAIVDVILCIGFFSYNITVFLVLGKLYSNVLMATLNGRMSSGPSRGGDVSVQTVFWGELIDMAPDVPVHVHVNEVKDESQ
ncbi:hypothetical protein MSAN_02074000 [Mycena sanguinolenta]|uniref:DUF6534 domain-containing protein n=1 Tax=Mycena sanguinolenta TaxID=230812 RepID=A0A8H6XJQ6_9AGAR|nr:hypothetical protein MSAN_02074000 [Mycena sanguinolenta]